MTVTEILNLLALIIIPIFAVALGRWLQDIADKRKDKMRIFTTLMTDRLYPWSKEGVEALNCIDIVFADDKAVRLAWKDLKERYNVSELTPNQVVGINHAQCRLLEAIANSLGYRDKITWEDIQSPYVPVGLARQKEMQESYNTNMIQIMKNLKENMINETSSEGDVSNNVN